MNKVRRNAIEVVVTKLESLKEEIEGILNDEQECFDNMPESLQDSERGYVAQDAIDNLEESLSSIDDAIDCLNDASV